MQTDLDNSYYIVKYDDESGHRGCPRLLKGELNQKRFEWETTEPPPEGFTAKLKYAFKAKHTLIDFDFNADHHFIASERFCRLCESMNTKARRIPLEITQSNGTRTSKEYFYLLCLDWVNALDLARSKVAISKDISSGEVVRSALSPDRPDIEAIFSAEPLMSSLQGKHFVRAIDMGGAFVCSSDFKKSAETTKMLGCKFVPFREYRDIPFWMNEDNS